MRRLLRKWIVLSAVLLAMAGLAAVQAGAGTPRVKEVKFNATVNSNYYIAIPTSTWGGADNATIYVMPGNSSGNASSGGPNFTGVGGPDWSASAEANMSGVAQGYGTMPVAFQVGNIATLNTNMPTNNNTQIFGAAQAPVNKNNISLKDAGLANQTMVQFTVDMNGSIPHLVGVMGGTRPIVSYDSSGTGTLTINSTTVDITNFVGEQFNSTFGFMLFTDETFEGTPLKLAVQSDSWVGDMFPLLPGFTTNAANSSIGGTKGTATARCGTTFVGQTGNTVNISLFFPEASVPLFFGSDVNFSKLAGFDGTIQQNGSTVSVVDNFGGQGLLVQFSLTYASKKDANISSTNETAKLDLGSGNVITLQNPDNIPVVGVGTTAVGDSTTIQMPQSYRINSPTGMGSSIANADLTTINALSVQLNEANASIIKNDATYGAYIDNSTFNVLYSPPLFTANVTTAGDKALFGWQFNGTAMNKTISEVAVYKFTSAVGTKAKSALRYNVYTTNSVLGSDGDMWFTLASNNGSVLAGDTLMDGNNTFIMWAVIQDDGNYDQDDTDKLIMDPPTVSPAPASASGSSSSGCMANPSAGFGLEWLLMALAPILARLRRR